MAPTTRRIPVVVSTTTVPTRTGSSCLSNFIDNLQTTLSRLVGSFDRPIGAQPDVNELEYISFLHQSVSWHCRTDASIKAEDIVLFLRSRYGIIVKEHIVKHSIMRNLGGGNDIDLMELLAMLLIPIFIKSSTIEYYKSTPNSNNTTTPNTNTTTNNGSSNQQQNANTPITSNMTVATFVTNYNANIFGPCTENEEKNKYHTCSNNNINNNINFISNNTNTQETDIEEQQSTVNNNNNNNKNEKIDDLYKSSHVSSFRSSNRYYRSQRVNEQALDQENDDETDSYELELPQEQEQEGTQQAWTSNKPNKNNNDNTPKSTVFLQQLPNGVMLPPDNIYEYATKLLLHDLTGDTKHNNNNSNTSNTIPLNEKLLKRLLMNYGEYEIANNDTLLKEMITTATIATHQFLNHTDTDINNTTTTDNNSDDVTIFFNSTTLAAVASYDIKDEYDLSNETKMSSYYQDVFPPDVYDDDTNTNAISNRSINNGKKMFPSFMERNQTGSQIDVTASTFRSKNLMILLWTTSILSFVVFYIRRADNSLEGKNDIVSIEDNYCARTVPYNTTWEAHYEPWRANKYALGCDVSMRIRDWLCLFLIVGTFGFAFTSMGATGNSIKVKWWRPLLGCIPVLILSTRVLYDPPSIRFLEIISWIALVLGGCVIAHHIEHVLSILLYEHPDFKNRLYKPILTLLYKIIGKPRDVISELHGKQATASKLNQLLRNSIRLFQHAENNESYTRTYYNRAIYVFGKHGVHSIDKNIGGLVWTWTSIWNSTLYSVEGIRLSVRVVASNLGQFMVCILLIIFGVNVMEHVNENFFDYDYVRIRAKTFVNNTMIEVIQTQIQQVSNEIGIDTSDESDTILRLVIGLVDKSIDHVVLTYFPLKSYMIRFPLIVGIVVAFITSLSLAINCISYTSSIILQLRCGLLQSLHSNASFRYHSDQDTVAILTGSIFWGCLFSSVLSGFFFGGIVFLLVWQVSAVLLQPVLAVVIGLIILEVFRCLHLLYRSGFFGGFYRRNPLVCNIGLLVLEWANFTLSIGFIIGRSIKLLLISGYAIGRIYRPFLAPGVGALGKMEWDGYHTMYLRELMAHEAHRHPYIELLGYVYLLKLKNGQNFATTAGSAWRLLIVHAMFPWLHRYRLESKRPSILAAVQNCSNFYEGPKIIEQDETINTTDEDKNNSRGTNRVSETTEQIADPTISMRPIRST